MDRGFPTLWAIKVYGLFTLFEFALAWGMPG